MFSSNIIIFSSNPNKIANHLYILIFCWLSSSFFKFPLLCFTSMVDISEKLPGHYSPPTCPCLALLLLRHSSTRYLLEDYYFIDEFYALRPKPLDIGALSKL